MRSARGRFNDGKRRGRIVSGNGTAGPMMSLVRYGTRKERDQAVRFGTRSLHAVSRTSDSSPIELFFERVPTTVELAQNL
jgi:hypothetical protein